MIINYEHYWENNSSHSNHPSVRLRNRFILKQLKKIRYNTLLDIGCGDGYLLNEINNKFSDKKLTGYDLSNSIIKINTLKYSNIKFLQLDISKSYREIGKKFDVIVCSEVIEHLEDWETALKNISDLLNEHGYLLLTTQSGKRYKSDIENGHIRHFKLENLEEKLLNLNLKAFVSYKKGFPFYNLQKWFHGKFENTAHGFQKGKLGDSFMGKVIFSTSYHLFLLTPKSRKLGPQIYIVARKEAN